MPRIGDTLDKYELYFDGSCEPVNPNGDMGMGILLKKNSEVIAAIGHKIRFGTFGYDRTTNNLAEYLALKKGLEVAVENGARQLIIYGDSQLVIKQMSGEWAIKGGVYATTAKLCKKLDSEFLRTSYRWIPREENTHADKLSK